MRLLDQVAASATLERAFAWLCRQRRRWPDAADVWELRRRWPEEKALLSAELRAGSFRFGLLERVEREDGAQIEVFPARDAALLKALALVLGPLLPISRRCVHVKGHGGAKAALRQAAARLRRLPFVLRTDVRGYYASIDPVKLVERLARHVPDPEILRLVAALTARTSTRGGLTFDSGGLPLGCPLSPLLGAFFLGELDERLEATGLFCVRFMDDVLVLAPTRWKLRRAVRVLNESFAALGLEKHPDKTFIGRAAKGFDFLGYHLSPRGIRLARQTCQRFAARAARLQERERTRRAPSGALGAYVRRWRRWTRAGLGRLGAIEPDLRLHPLAPGPSTTARATVERFLERAHRPTTKTGGSLRLPPVGRVFFGWPGSGIGVVEGDPPRPRLIPGGTAAQTH